jgi:hypothetical protein
VNQFKAMLLMVLQISQCSGAIPLLSFVDSLSGLFYLAHSSPYADLWLWRHTWDDNLGGAP